ncbi:MAG: hypothetical protein LBH22_09095 [Bacteroidales bacterium]|jgi:hypothetical protein|nr:hypothetical protein [Bacteroidales bacterium]
MKKTTFTVLFAVVIAWLCTATQCEKEPPITELPPETQTGAHTFGCYVNDELFVPRRPTSNSRLLLFAGYDPETNQFAIGSKSTNRNYQEMFFIIDNPRENEYLSFSILDLTEVIWRTCFEFGNTCYDSYDSGHVFFTRFDTINNIASGRFEFSGHCAQCFNDEERNVLKIQITSGRFDVRFSKGRLDMIFSWHWRY